MSSSPRSIGGNVREGNRVVLREITASLNNSPPMQLSRSKSGNDSPIGKTAEHEVKVRFAREFADVGSISYSAADSLSTTSSFQSLSSGLSAKSSSGICPDSVPQSPCQPANNSYLNVDIPGVEDLILGCAEIRLNGEDEDLFDADSQEDQTFTSATDRTIEDITKNITVDASLVNSCDVTRDVEDDFASQTIPYSLLNYAEDLQERPILVVDPLSVSSTSSSFVKENSISHNRSDDLVNDLGASDFAAPNEVKDASVSSVDVEESNLNSTVPLSPKEAISANTPGPKERVLEISPTEVDVLPLNFVPFATVHSLTSPTIVREHAEEPSLPTISSLTSTNSVLSSVSVVHEIENDVQDLLLARSLSPVSDFNVDLPPVSLQDLLRSPVQEIEDKSDVQTEAISPSLCDATNDEESGTNLLNDIVVLRPKTPDVEGNSEASACTDADFNSATGGNVQVSPVKINSPELNVSSLIKVKEQAEEEAKEEAENKAREEEENKDKLNESSKAKEIDIVETIDVKNSPKEKENEADGGESSNERLDTTLTFQDVFLNTEAAPELDQYTEFKPKRQSTSLGLPDIEQSNFDELKLAAEEVADDIFKSSVEFSEESDRFVSATSQFFQEPMNFDLLISHGNTKTINRLHTESLYVKFDPLVSDTSMLPQGNVQPVNDEQNGKTDSPPPTIATPKRNPAIAAIDRLLFFSPLSTSMTQKAEEPQEKIEQPAEESKPEAPLIIDINMSKELELVRTTVLQLEEELEKQKKEYEAELERQKNSFQEKMNKLQAQIAQEVKSKSQMTVVVEEYEKSISRLLTERERDRANFAQEKAKLQEELQATNVHLDNTEAAFNGVHQKYERLKDVVSVYKRNESVLKESIQENLETISSLEARYEKLKTHAMAELEKANFELDSIQKRHEDEMVKLHAIIKKAELKNNSLTDLVEQKTKENIELTQILDEVIARVGHQNTE